MASLHGIMEDGLVLYLPERCEQYRQEAISCCSQANGKLM